MVDGTAVETGTALKYLGLLLDSRWRFREHFESLAPRVSRAAAALSRLLPNLGGPSAGVRRLYATVVHSMLLYGAPVWAAEAQRSESIKRLLHRAQVRIATRVARAYRTVSFGAVTVLSGTLPAELMANVHLKVYEARRAMVRPITAVALRKLAAYRDKVKQEAILQWQASLREYHRLAGARTLEAIQPVLPQWVGREHGHLSFHLTQLLSGHGSFGSFLHRIGKAPSKGCRHCDHDLDTTEHTILVCPAWTDQREALKRVVGSDLSLPALIRAMLASEEGWRAVAKFALDVMHLKEEDERERERQSRASLSLSLSLERPPSSGGGS